MKRFLLTVGILSALLFSSCWPFGMRNGKRVVSGSYYCDTGRIELNAPTSNGSVLITPLMGTSSGQNYGLTNEGMVELRRILSQLCDNTIHQEPETSDSTVIRVNYDEPPSSSAGPTVFSGRNLLGRFEKQSPKKIKLVVYEMDPGDNAAAVQDFVSARFKEQSCNRTSKRCIACRKNAGSYRWYCSIPNG